MTWEAFLKDYHMQRRTRKYGFIDKNGSFVIPPQYERARSFYEGRAAVQLNKKWGFIDKNGDGRGSGGI